MKKLISSILAMSLLIVTALNVFAETPDLFEGVNEIVVNEYSQINTSLYSTYSLESEDTIIHNNGNAIKSDYLVNGKEEGNYLIAIKYENSDYGIVETAYFANKESVSADDLIRIVSEDNNSNISEMSVATKSRSADDPIYKRYNWTFYLGDIVEATLTSVVNLTRQTSTATINGVSCSVWDVTTFTQLEKDMCYRLNNQYTRLSVDLQNQTLVAYGPTESTSGGDVSVGLDGAGVPSISYTFSIEGFSVDNLSSLNDNYGRWKFSNGVGFETSMTTEPGIRATNTTGDFVVELSHTTNVTALTGLYNNHQTGVIQIYCSDR